MALGEWKDRIIIQKSAAGNDKAGNHVLSWQDYYTAAVLILDTAFVICGRTIVRLK